MNYKVGDIVYAARGIIPLRSGSAEPLSGVVKHIKDDGDNIGIVFNELVHGGHALDNQCCPHGYGYYLGKQYLQKMEPVDVVLKNNWDKDWKPKLKKRVPYYQEPIILIEE